MGRHDGCKFRQFAVGEHVPHQTLRIPFVLGKGGMAVGLGPAVPREVLAAGGHAAPAKPADERGGMRRHELGRRAEAARADHGRAAVVDVEHGREGEVDAAGAKLGGKHETGRLEARFGVLARRDLGHGGHFGEFGAEALHAAALMVDADEDARTHGVDFIAQRPELFPVPVVAGEEDHHARHRMTQTLALMFGE